jgi:hypothetical protein
VEEAIKMTLKFQSYLIVKRRPTDSREIELSTSGGYIVWRYVGDLEWINLCLIPADGSNGADGAPGVDGAPGTNGDDGRDVEFSVVYNHLVWRFVGDETWIDLFELPTDGNDGATGAAGANGNTPYIEGGYWYINGVNTGVLATGTPGTPGVPGANGNTPYIQSGYWYINGVSTGTLATGPMGATGTSRYTYAAYASTNTGTGWSLTPTNALKYRAEIYTTNPLTPPIVGNFSGATWLKYIGDDGENGVTVTQVSGLTVLASGWVADGSLFKYELSDPSITSASIVEVIPSNSSYDVLVVAEPMPETVSSTGIVTFWAKAIPTENISVTINITEPL